MNSNRVALYDSDADYINASFVRGHNQKREFVVTQHPLQETKGDFWRMVLERDIATIVMIGPLSDADDKVWPPFCLLLLIWADPVCENSA